ncbi:subclass B3 metallo-beta-lactamase [Lysobacter humi (ex Lee et al. 2017)]
MKHAMPMVAAAVSSMLLAACAASRPEPATAPVAATRQVVRMPMPPSAPPSPCAADAGWDDPASPRRVHGDTWYVGTCGITALLVASPAGHVLIDSGTENGATQVLANLRMLGVDIRDVRYILTSHVHHDHVGGVATLQRESGATVVAMVDAATVLRTGRSLPGDPQHGSLSPFAPVSAVRTIADREALRVGALTFTAQATPGHAPGGTSWTWRSCDAAGCVDIAYADSLTAVSAPGYRFSDARANPTVVPAFHATFERVAALPCDVLLTPHPQASALWSRLGPGATQPLVARGACRDYVAAARRRLDARLAEETATP